MRLFASIIFTSAALALGASAEEPKEKATLAKFKGEWRLAYGTDGHEKIAPAKKDEARLAVGDDSIAWANLPYLPKGPDGQADKILMAKDDSGTAEFKIGGKTFKAFFSITKPSPAGKKVDGDEPETLQLAIGLPGGPAPKAMPKKDFKELPADTGYFYRFFRVKGEK